MLNIWVSRRPRDPLFCGRTSWKKQKVCRQPAGGGTRHVGYGPCRYHGGGTRAAEGAWLMAFELAERYEVDPWAALLLAVRLSAYHAQQVDMILATLRAPESNSDEALVRAWQHESRMERMLLAKTAKSAIDAGVAERLVREVELEGQLVALAVVAALDSLEITQDDRTRALEAAHRKLAEGVDDAPSSRGL